uniref:ASC1-like protein n=1 Tax=Nicotiana tabacum TaxID=4097 RepID=A0A1S4DPE3_TOBAC|nr:PREDICTED: ASC1-like protein [Nicotiana tabacum]
MGMLQIGSFLNWEYESYPAYEDFAVLPLFAFFFPTVRFLLDRFVFEVTFLCGFVSFDDFGMDESKCSKHPLKSFKKNLYDFLPSPKSWWAELPATCAARDSSYWLSVFIICRFARVGSVVLALHDASDIFLEIGKMSKYSGAEALASFSFILFVLSWIVLRLTYFPFWVLWSTSYEVLQTLDKEKHKVDGPIYYYIFNSLLFCLMVLHIYWWVLIYRMLVKQIQARGQLSEDVRSDSEDEHED